MFHLFTLQGKRMDVLLEHLPENVRVHRTGGNARVRKFAGGELSFNANVKSGSGYGADLYKKVSNMEYEKSPVFHASEIMSSPVVTVRPEITIREAWSLFLNENVHHMPVVSENDKITGIISDRDLLKKLIINDGVVEKAEDSTVFDVMTKEVIAASPYTDIRRIAKAMFDHHIGAMPVVDQDGSLKGIITRSDILYAVIHRPELRLWA